MALHALLPSDRRPAGPLSECLAAVTRCAPQLRLKQLQMFLMVARREGLTISELTALSGQSEATVSRGVRAMTSSGDPGALAPASGLLQLKVNGGDRRVRHVVLTEKGRQLHEQIVSLLHG